MPRKYELGPSLVHRASSHAGQPLTLLGDQLNLRNEPQITQRGHQVIEQDPTVADGALVLAKDWPPSPKADPGRTISQHDLDSP